MSNDHLLKIGQLNIHSEVVADRRKARSQILIRSIIPGPGIDQRDDILMDDYVSKRQVLRKYFEWQSVDPCAI